jgi:PAS domain S-box-containing protein
MTKATHLLRQASELVREKSYAEAVEVYLSATEADPGDCRAWFGLGVCLYKIGNLDVARIALERAQKMGYPKADEALAHLHAAERRRSEQHTGAKATVPQKATSRPAASRPASSAPDAPRPITRPEEQKLDLGRYMRVMLVENLETDRELITQALQGQIRHLEVVSVPYTASTSDTMSGTVHYDVAIMDWDADPDAASGLIQILKIKRAGLLVICLTEAWDPETAVQIFESGADYHLVKGEHYALSLPLIVNGWARRDRAIALQQRGKDTDAGAAQKWPESLNSVGEMMVYVAPDYAVVQANQATMKSLRMREEQVVGRPYCEAIYGQEEPPEDCPLARALASGQPVTGEILHPQLKKTYVVYAWPEVSPGGSVAGVVALLREKAVSEMLPEELREREWLYRNLTERASAGIAMVGPQGTLCYVNRAFCTMLDHTADETAEQPIEKFVPPEDQQSLRECLEVALDIGESGGRVTLQRADGSRFPAEARIARFSSEEQTYLVLTFIGAAELEEAEKALWDERSKFASILDKGVERLECGVTVLDREGRITWINSLAAELFSQQREELVGKDYGRLLAEFARTRVSDAPKFLDSLADARRREKPVEDYGLELVGSPAGERLHYWSTPARSGSPAVHRVEHFYATPVAAPALPATRDESIARIADAMPEMLFTTDERGRITWCNPAAAALSGCAEQSLLGKDLSALAAEEARATVTDMIREAFERGRLVGGREVVISRPDGARVWAELTLLPTSNGHKGLQGALRDVSDRKMTDAIRAILSGAVAPS